MKAERPGAPDATIANESAPAGFAPAHGSASGDDAQYQAFVESMVKHCRCAPPHSCPCDGVLAGGLCDEMGREPDYTMDDLEWSEEHD